MRADRLLSLLMLLQTRGQMTARQLAETLEVSERTIYRDIDALSMAGVPVYGEPGPDGGYALLDSYRTNLTGLSESEVRALFMLSIPEPLVHLGVKQDLQAALLKLTAALPATRQGDEQQVRQRIHIDATWWHQGEAPLPYLEMLYQAVWQDRRVHLTYRLPSGFEAEHLFDPYGLVAKGGTWYLVCARGELVQARRVGDLLGARLSEEGFQRPPGFDLQAFWRGWCADQERTRALYPVVLRVAPEAMPALAARFGAARARRVRECIAQAGPADADGWLTIEIAFESLYAARDRILPLGSAVQVVTPEPLRRSVLDYAEQIVSLYT
jgi:predicted DNA-binding transcriptional regulator YafY